MKLRSTKTLTSMLLLAVALSTSAFAEEADHSPTFPSYPSHPGHHPGGGLNWLQSEASQLNSMVQSNYFRYPVKAAVQSFYNQVSMLPGYCVRSHRMNTDYLDTSIEAEDSVDHIPGHHRPDPYDHGHNGCRMRIQNVMSEWRSVERYLYDTNYDYPHVYRQYLQTRDALYSVIRR